MPYELCRHLKANGLRCHSPALTGEVWCYFHTRLHFRHRAARSSKPQVAANSLHLPVIEDRASLGVAASIVVGALSSGHIDEKRANAIIRALSFVLTNLDRSNEVPPPPETITPSYTPTLEGLELAPRRMNDNSTLPENPRRKGSPDPDLQRPAEPEFSTPTS